MVLLFAHKNNEGEGGWIVDPMRQKRFCPNGAQMKTYDNLQFRDR